jgi:tripartite-type tricarboxylate transporter receptor subunit TctC
MYPTKPIRLVIPFAAGGVADQIARAIGQKLTEAWGQEIVSDNRGGAGGNIGAAVVAKAPPDGYTLLLGNLGLLAINPAVYKEVPFDSVQSFEPITLVAGTPLILVANPALPARSIKELIALAKARPGQLNFASAGAGGPTHLAVEVLKQAASIDVVHVPYKGNIAALTALVGGETQLMFSSLLTPQAFIAGGRLVPIAVSSRKRQPAMPDVPTIDESGLKGFDVSGWYGILAPRGASKELVAKLNTEIVKIMQRRDVHDQFVKQGVEIFTSTPAEFAQRIRDDLARWGKVARDARVVVY